ncbi:hypothetical protein GCM10010967_55010 [Dyadobacter beijingensis]|uniref:VWFD domain-containing protein n=1 Tax=Dyadobacter beijingensis TaxID=365489 RepID=A0ABQ2IHU7_9BACT|nr:VWD domain-containing protein [Dyadobacter beijingensis]GGN12039.1 hypothetical protein GCM10010967_55010 [Dyadobacter beijingensis]
MKYLLTHLSRPAAPAFARRMVLLIALFALPFACKEKENTPDAASNGPVGIRYHQLILPCTDPATGNKGVAILDFRFDTYAGDEADGYGFGKYMAFNTKDLTTIDAAIQTANADIAAGAAEVKNFPTMTDFLSARLSKVPGFATSKDLSADAVWGVLAGEETAIASLHGTEKTFDWDKFLTDLLATPAYAQGYVQPAEGTDYHASYYYRPAPSPGSPLPVYKMVNPVKQAQMPTNAQPEQRNSRGETPAQQAAREEAARSAAQAARTNRGPRNLSDAFNGIFERLGEGLGLPGGGSTGDPHFRTHDGLNYDFQTIGEFVAAKASGIEIQGRQEDVDKTNRASVNTGVAARLGSDEICFLMKPGLSNTAKLYINKKETAISAAAQAALGNGNKIRLEGGQKLVFTNAKSEGVSIYWNAFSLDYMVLLSPERKGQMTGLMGNYDGDFSNDFKLADGTAVDPLFASITGPFADAWRVSDATSLFIYENGRNTASFTDRNFPKTFPVVSPEKLAWAEGVCRTAGVTRQPELGHCMFDVGLTGDERLAQSALHSQQEFPAGPDVAAFTSLKVDLKERPSDDPESRILLDLDRGTFYTLARGAAVARDIDIVFDFYAGPWFAGPRAVKNCGVSCGAYNIWPRIEAQQWPYFQNTFLRYTSIPANQWDTFTRAEDLRRAWTFDQGADEKTELTHPLTDLTTTAPLSQYLWSFTTQQGKKGLIRFTQAQAGKTSASFVFDVKIER